MTLAPIIFLGCLIFWIANLIYVKYKERKLIELVTPITRGEWSERRVILNLLKEGINPKAIFHDLYIQKQNGEYTQVDVAVATKTGIIVFEVKDYSGWIFGNEHQRYWTQILAYGKEKHRFYNPVMQNAGHIKAIRRCLPQNPGIPIYSVIVFFGSSEFKNITCNADNTFIIYPHSIRQVVSEILRQPDANFGNKYEIVIPTFRDIANLLVRLTYTKSYITAKIGVTYKFNSGKGFRAPRIEKNTDNSRFSKE